MIKILLGGLIFFGLFVGFLYLLSSGLDAQSRATMAQAHLEYTRAEAQANIIRASSQAALQSSQASQQNALAFSMVLMTLIPWGVLFTASLLGLGVLVLVFSLAYFRHKDRQIPQIPSRHFVIYLPNPELPRREVWQALSGNREIIPLDHHVLHKILTYSDN